MTGLRPVNIKIGPKGDLAEKFATQGPCGNIYGNGNLWLKITAFGGVTSTKILQRCRMSPKSWQKYLKDGFKIFFPKPFVCHISTKSIWISFKLVQCTSMIRLCPKSTLCRKFCA